MKKQGKTIKIDRDDWICIGLTTGWIKESAGYDYQNATGYTRPVDVSGDVNRVMQQQIMTQQQWTNAFMNRLQTIYATIQQDIKSLQNLGIDDNRVVTLKNMLSNVLIQMETADPHLKSLKNDIDSGAIIENEIAVNAEESTAYTMNSPAPSNEGVQGK